MYHKFTTLVAGNTVYQGENLEEAIRTWDAETFDFDPEKLEGGITVQSFNEYNVMVRDGYVLHVQLMGAVYLNPNIELK